MALFCGGGSDGQMCLMMPFFIGRQVRLAPTLILIGFGIEVYAILINQQRFKFQ
jgi:hypothetical protein